MFQFLPAATAETAYLGYSDYQIVTDPGFDAEEYLIATQSYGVNFQRIWVTGYSNAGGRIDERMPFIERDGKYALLELDPAYLDRLTNVLTLARKHGQRVMLTLFDHWSLSTIFERTPWHYRNNHERALKKGIPDFYSIKDRKLTRIQERFVRQIVSATKEFEPIYEIMNEAGGANCRILHRWHAKVAGWILEEDPDAELAVNLMQECDAVLTADWVDVISYHAGSWLDPGICATVRQSPGKNVIIDTDGAWKIRHDNDLVRSWLLETVKCGASFNHKDDIYKPDLEILKFYRAIRDDTEAKERTR